MIEIQANRASALFKQAADNLNQVLPENSGSWLFTYWCKFYGENPDERENSIRLIDADIYNTLESKAKVNQLLEKYEIADVFPATFTSTQAALNHPEAVDIWFVKPYHLSGGRGIQVIASDRLKDFELPAFNIIQAGIENLKLIDGKKFTARIYLLLWNGQVYLFDDGFIMIHAPQYRKGSTEYGVQVDHRGYESGDRGVEVRLFSEYRDFSASLAEAKASVQKIMPIFTDALAASSAKRYILLGIDLLPVEDGSVKLIEINAMPNFVHSSRVNRELNVPFLEHVMRKICGLGSRRFTQIDTQPSKDAATSTASPKFFVLRKSAQTT